jgi:glucose-6-phosphate-specific signal transduction histidine kinase
MRRVLGVLRDATDTPDFAPAPQVADIDRLLLTIRRTGLRATLTCEGPTADLPADLQLSIYRLVQESLTNTMKHAVDATIVTIGIRRGAGGTVVVVTDDGESAGPGTGQMGHGIIGMRERAAAYAGRVDVGPTGRGWRVHASFPEAASEQLDVVAVTAPGQSRRTGEHQDAPAARVPG